MYPTGSSHELKFQRWFFEKAQPWLTAKRGRYAALARHLEVSRQTISRWFVRRQPVPGWAAVAMNVWLNQQWRAEQQQAALPIVTAQADSRFKALEFVAGSGDKLVTPQADEQVQVMVRR